MRKISSRTCLFFLFCLMLSTHSVAQRLSKEKWSVGISAGYTNNELYTNISNYDYSSYKKEGGFVVSVPVQYAIRDWVSVQIEPGYIQKSFSLVQTLQTQEPTRLVSRYNYLQLPLMAHFSFGAGKWHGFVNAGGYGSYWISGNIKGTQPDIYNQFLPSTVVVFHTQDVNGRYEFDSRKDRRLQFGWLAGGGLQYTLNKKLELFAEGRYYQDLTDQQKSYMRNQVPRYNITTALSAGCFYHFSSKKHK